MKLDKDFNPNVGSGAEPHEQSHKEAEAIAARLDSHDHKPFGSKRQTIDTSSRPE